MKARERKDASRSTDAVAEMTGLYGSFAFLEILLQQIWLRGEFDSTALRLRDGRSLRLIKRGRWNRLAGPDFRDAEFVIEPEGEAPVVVRGDIEVHLRAQDWDAHGHSADQTYAGVGLHVVLFPASRSFTVGFSGRTIPILELLPLLEKDIEAYAEEAAVEGIAGRPFSQLRAALAGIAADQLIEAVGRHADRRWNAKVQLAGRRIERLGWAEACHQAALEVLGYRPNRDPMLAVAEAFPLARWQGARVGEGLRVAEEARLSQLENWRVGGVRPANLPGRRLCQYARWVEKRPDWPERLHLLGATLGDRMAAGAGELRRTSLRDWILDEICAGELGGTRFDTWWCDAALPLLAARSASGGGARHAQLFQACWQGWGIGDLPEELVRLAREFGVGSASFRGRPAPRQGELQGMLGWLATLSER